jgi:ribosome biogenesis GTPase
MPGERKAVIHHVLPRRTKLSRKEPGREVEEQILATNVDKAFVVQGLDRPPKPALVQRFLVMIYESGIKPVVLLNKTDLSESVSRLQAEAERAAGGAPVLTVSASTGQGVEDLAKLISPGETVIFVGPSGVGKSSLINRLYGEEVQATAEVRESDAKGRHTTTWRELILLPSGGLVIDTPGMREFQMWLADEGVHEAFPEIEDLAVACHFRDCTHTAERRCAVLEAVARGTLSQARYESYLKLSRELAFMEQAHTLHGYMRRSREAKAAQRALNRYKRNPGVG